jgi:hypothetical protein
MDTLNSTHMRVRSLLYPTENMLSSDSAPQFLVHGIPLKPPRARQIPIQRLKSHTNPCTQSSSDDLETILPV